jgi:uncharacterized protein YeaO (DUF488 family)
MAKRKQTIAIARVYDAPTARGRFRVLVDRLWPRGIRKESLQLDLWAKDLAPSNALRKWFQHDPERWDEFRSRYFAELEERSEVLAELLSQLRDRPLLLLYAAKDEVHNNAAALREYLRKRKRPRKNAVPRSRASR